MLTTCLIIFAYIINDFFRELKDAKDRQGQQVQWVLKETR